MSIDDGLNLMEQAMFILNMRSPISRFAGVFVATNAIVYFVKPPYFFDSVTERPNPNAIIPWWMLGLSAGGIAALFL